ncbi:MAG: homoserine kinase [Pseudothermotoga sp.]
MIRVRVPATSANLGPGFDVIGMALSIFNEVSVDESSKNFEIEITGEGADKISKDKDNLVYLAFCKVFERLGKTAKNIKLILKNQIPLSRGLGSSSAAIVSGLVAANAYLGFPLKAEELLQMAVELEGHPDNVAPALFGGMVLCGLPELRYVKLPNPELDVVLAIPNFEVKTSEARKILPKEVPFEDVKANLRSIAFLITSFYTKKYDLLEIGMQDRLHQPYRSQLIPGFYQVMQAAKEAGALGVALSGSGPTVIAFTKLPQTVAQVMQEAFMKVQVKAETLITKPQEKGALELVEIEK